MSTAGSFRNMGNVKTLTKAMTQIQTKREVVMWRNRPFLRSLVLRSGKIEARWLQRSGSTPFQNTTSGGAPSEQ